MKYSVAARISEMKLNRPEAKTVCFIYDDSKYNMSIETFLNQYGLRECGCNDEIYYENVKYSVNNFIKYIY